MKWSAVLALAVLACDRSTSTPVPPADAAPSASVVASAVVPPRVFDAGPPVANPFGLPEVEDPSAKDECGVEPQKIKTAKSVGHTSVVYKIELEGGRKLAWKPNAKKVKDRWRGEVAAFRLGRLLGLPNVPPACVRTYASEDIAALLGRPAVDDLIVTSGKIEGVLIPWIPGLQFMALEKEPLRSETRAWLRASTKSIPSEKVRLATQLSTLVVFDVLTGNWDRYSGANVGLDASGKMLLFIDNDAAFMDGPPTQRIEENLALLADTDRFSRSFVTQLRALDEPHLVAALGTTSTGAPLLSAAMTALVVTRAREALKIIDAKIAARSEALVLAFP